MNMRHVIDLLKRADLHDEAAAVGMVMQQRAELLEALRENVDNAEQSAFEAWLTSECPSGDSEAVHRKWLASWEFKDFCEMWKKSREAITKAEAAE